MHLVKHELTRAHLPGRQQYAMLVKALQQQKGMHTGNSCDASVELQLCTIHKSEAHEKHIRHLPLIM